MITAKEALELLEQTQVNRDAIAEKECRNIEFLVRRYAEEGIRKFDHYVHEYVLNEVIERLRSYGYNVVRLDNVEEPCSNHGVITISF